MLWLTQAEGREGYGSHNWNVGEPTAAEASIVLQQPEAHCVSSWGGCPWIRGHWQWRAAQSPGGVGCGVDSDLCLHTGFLVAVAALTFHDHLWGPS